MASSPNKAERDKRQELTKDIPMGIATFSIPAKTKAWLINEAYRRRIPVSWLATEVLDHGIVAYKLMSDTVIEDM